MVDRPGDSSAPGAIEARLRSFIESDLLGGRATIEPGENLLSGGLLDSVAVLRLASFVAEEFEFEIQPADFVIENFQTLNTLTAYVQRATATAT